MQATTEILDTKVERLGKKAADLTTRLDSLKAKHAEASTVQEQKDGQVEKMREALKSGTAGVEALSRARGDAASAAQIASDLAEAVASVDAELHGVNGELREATHAKEVERQKSIGAPIRAEAEACVEGIVDAIASVHQLIGRRQFLLARLRSELPLAGEPERPSFDNLATMLGSKWTGPRPWGSAGTPAEHMNLRQLIRETLLGPGAHSGYGEYLEKAGIREN